jgi:hypothetical protein
VRNVFRRFSRGRDPLLQRDPRTDPAVIPNTVGLHPGDAQRLLRLQGLASRAEGSGSEVIATDPGAEELASRDRAVVLRTTPL